MCMRDEETRPAELSSRADWRQGNGNEGSGMRVWPPWTRVQLQRLAVMGAENQCVELEHEDGDRAQAWGVDASTVADVGLIVARSDRSTHTASVRRARVGILND